MAKLLNLFENYLACGSSSCEAAKWIERVQSQYSMHTLMRMLSSQRAEIRQAAAWALGNLGNELHLSGLGLLLRDSVRMVRTHADEARRAIAQRTQSPWHRKTANRIEQYLADGQYGMAGELADHLVDEAERRADVYMLRAWVRFSEGEIETAADDCKKTLAIDPFCYQAYLAGLDEFRRTCTDVRIATEDGSMGYRGRVTDILIEQLDQNANDCRIACCGPEPMMAAVSEIAARYQVPCEVSLETPMACGIGICYTCVARVRQSDGSWDYKRTCVEGPVFDAQLIDW